MNDATNTTTHRRDVDDQVNVDLNQSMPLNEVIQRLRRDADTRVDVVLDTKQNLTARYDEEARDVVTDFAAPEIGTIDGRSLPATRFAHKQVAARTGIPKAYYDRMRDAAPALLADNINHWWNSEPETRLVRTVGSNGDGRVRAFLSDRFRILDNLDFLTTTFEAAEPFNAQVRNAHVTDDRLYVQLVTPRIMDIPKRRGDAVQLGITVRNSEVGDGRVTVQPWLLRLVCLNGMVAPVNYKKTHLGSTLDIGILSDETIRLEAASVWSQVSDWVRYALHEDRFTDLLEQMDLATQTEIKAKPRIAVANVVRNIGLNRSEGMAVLERYLKQDDPTQFGMSQAVTFVAHDSAATFRRRIALEEAGGEMIATSASRFTAITSKPVTDRDMERLLGISAN